MAQATAPDGASVAAAQNVFVKAAAKSQLSSEAMKQPSKTASAPNSEKINQAYASGA